MNKFTQGHQRIKTLEEIVSEWWVGGKTADLVKAEPRSRISGTSFIKVYNKQISLS
jgi:hypothetical protein